MASTFLHCAPTTAATFLTIGVPDIDDDDGGGDDGGDGDGDDGDDGDDDCDDGDGDEDGDGDGFNFFLTVAHSRCNFFSPEVLPLEMRSR